MQITFNPANINYYRYSNPSFLAMKKSQFSGIDRFVVEKYNAPIEKFNGHDDFNRYCTKSVEDIENQNYGGKDEEAKIQRKGVLDEWYKYVTIENQAYTPAMQFMILKGITNSLKPNEDTLPPVLNKGVLADTVFEIEEKTKTQKDPKINFDKLYRNNLQKSIYEEEGNNLDKSLNGWIIIPSKKKDSKNFEANVAKLKTLSYKTWCTKSYNAEPYLEKGDFHVYIEHGVPTIGVRFVGNKIEEIQGQKNNSRIPLDYYDVVKKHIKGYKLTKNAENELNTLEKAKKEVKKFKEKYPKGIDNFTTEEIFDALKVKYKKLDDGMFEISSYDGMYNEDISYSDLGIDENKLFKKIKSITRYANFGTSNVTDLGNLESIGSYASFEYSQVSNLGKLKSIGWSACFRHTQITDLGNLEFIGGDADFENSKVTNLGKLESIGKDACFRHTQITDLGNLKSIDGSACFSYTQITDLGNLKYIGKNAYFQDSKVKKLGNLESIGGDAYFENSQVTDLGNLKYIGKNVYFKNSQLTNLGKLESIGGDVYYNQDSIVILPLLKDINIGGKIIQLGD